MRRSWRAASSIGRGQIVGGLDAADADARAQVRGLDEAGEAEPGGDQPRNRAGVAPPLVSPDQQVLHHRQPVGPEDVLHRRLVHADGRGEDARARVRQARQLEEALDGPVLALGAMEQDQHHVEAARGGPRAGPRSSPSARARSWPHRRRRGRAARAWSGPPPRPPPARAARPPGPARGADRRRRASARPWRCRWARRRSARGRWRPSPTRRPRGRPRAHPIVRRTPRPRAVACQP